MQEFLGSSWPRNFFVRESFYLKSNTVFLLTSESIIHIYSKYVGFLILVARSVKESDFAVYL